MHKIIASKQANVIYTQIKVNPTQETLGLKKKKHFLISELLFRGLGWPWHVTLAGFNTTIL